MSSLLRNILLGTAIAVFMGYLFFQLQGFFFSSYLEVFSPQDGAHLKNSHVKVEGRASGVSFLTIDGRKIFSDDNGFFEEELILPYGLHIITITGEGRFGKTFQEKRMVYVTGE